MLVYHLLTCPQLQEYSCRCHIHFLACRNKENRMGKQVCWFKVSYRNAIQWFHLQFHQWLSSSCLFQKRLITIGSRFLLWSEEEENEYGIPVRGLLYNVLGGICMGPRISFFVFLKPLVSARPCITSLWTISLCPAEERGCDCPDLVVCPPSRPRGQHLSLKEKKPNGQTKNTIISNLFSQ